MKCVFSLLLVGLVCLSTPSGAEQLMKLSPEMRLTRGTTDRGLASENVVIEAVTALNLPAQILEEVRARILTCQGNLDDRTSIRAYSWSSELNRSKKYPASYIIELTAPQTKTDKDGKIETRPGCESNVCTEEGCLVMGFVPMTPQRWTQDFELRLKKYGFFVTPLANGQKVMEIDGWSKRKDCEKVGGKENKGLCFRRFSWRNFGLSLLTIPAE